MLVIRRGHPPGEGLWSLPGGRVEPGESDERAVVREVHEETGLDVHVGPLLGAVERAGPGGVVFDIRDYTASVSAGALAAGTDASDARWVTHEELMRLPLTEGLLEALTQWKVLS